TAAASCCVIRVAGIGCRGTAVTDRRWTHPIVDAMAEEYASGARLPGVRTTTAATGTTAAPARGTKVPHSCVWNLDGGTKVPHYTSRWASVDLREVDGHPRQFFSLQQHAHRSRRLPDC